MKDNQLRKEFERLETILFGVRGSDASFEDMMGTISSNFGEMEKRLDSIHPCSTCKALFRIEDLQRVNKERTIERRVSVIDGEVTPEHTETESTLFYCPSHKVPYDRIQDGKYYKDNVEVDRTTKIVTEFGDALTSEQWEILRKKYEKYKWSQRKPR